MTEAAAHGEGAALRGGRLWFAGFVGWMVALAVVAKLGFAAFEEGSATGQAVWLLALLAFYLSLCNALLPLPTGWIVLFAATDSGLPGVPPALRLLLVTAVGGLATTLANLNEYHVLNHRAGARLRDRVRATPLYRWAVRWFDARPFPALLLVAFIPIPVDVIRWLAILRRYSRVRFAGAYFVGRGARYALFAGLSIGFRFGAWEILLVQVLILIGAAAGRVVLTKMVAGGRAADKAGETAAPQER
jgi:membrane protein YqaA with SNARE-associated domain